MFIFFDDPKDPAIEEIKKYPSSKVTYFKGDGEHSKRLKRKERNFPLRKGKGLIPSMHWI